MIHKISPSVDCDQWLKHSDAQLDEQTNQNSIIVSKVVGSTNKKTLLQILGTGVIISLMPPPSLVAFRYIYKKHNQITLAVTLLQSDRLTFGPSDIVPLFIIVNK